MSQIYLQQNSPRISTKNTTDGHKKYMCFATFKKITVQKMVKQQLLLQVDFQQKSTNNFNKKHKQPQQKNLAIQKWLSNNFCCRMICNINHQQFQQK